MPQDFDHPAVRPGGSAGAVGDGRSFDELRRDIEQGMAVLDTAIQRTRQSGPDEQSGWALKRVKTTMDKLRRVPGGDSFVVNRLTAEFARKENELKGAEKTWLLANKPSAAATGSSLSSSTAERSGDDDRATLLRANQTLSESNRVIDDIEQGLGQALQTGRSNLGTLHVQGQELETALGNVQQGNITAKNAGVVLRRMAQKAFYNRIFLWSIIVLFFLIDVLFLYYGFLKKGD